MVSKAKKSSFLKMLSLAILIRDGELHGYALYKKILYYTHMKWIPSIGTVYRVLNEMAREGLINKRVSGRKYVYSVTDKGIEYFIQQTIPSVTKVSGILATALEAYLKIMDNRHGLQIITEDLRDRLKTLSKVLNEYSSRKLI